MMGVSDSDAMAGPAQSGRDGIRDILRVLLFLCVLVFFFVAEDFVSYSTTPPSVQGTLFRLIVVTVLILAGYLSLVRVETGRWGLVHPELRNGLDVILVNRDYKKILLVVNGCFLAMAVITVLSGYAGSRSGQQFLVLCLSIWVGCDLLALWSLRRGDGQ